MAKSNSLSLEDVRRDPKLLKRFMREHPEPAEKKRFEALLDAMCQPVKRPTEGDQT